MHISNYINNEHDASVLSMLKTAIVGKQVLYLSNFCHLIFLVNYNSWKKIVDQNIKFIATKMATALLCVFLLFAFSFVYRFILTFIIFLMIIFLFNKMVSRLVRLYNCGVEKLVFQLPFVSYIILKSMSVVH